MTEGNITKLLAIEKNMVFVDAQLYVQPYKEVNAETGAKRHKYQDFK